MTLVLKVTRVAALLALVAAVVPQVLEAGCCRCGTPPVCGCSYGTGATSCDQCGN